MAQEFASKYRDGYRMNYSRPHEVLEPFSTELSIVRSALDFLETAGVINHSAYDVERFLQHRHAIEGAFNIPWTAISPRARHLLYAINSIHQPQILVAAGIHCGNTFISNTGAAIGPGKVYQASLLVGLELNPELALLAKANLATVDSTGIASIVCGDAIEYLRGFTQPLDLLYIDVEDEVTKDKSLYYEVLNAGLERLVPGGLVVAHNSVNHADELQDFLTMVRSKGQFLESVNVIVDHQGLEVSKKL